MVHRIGNGEKGLSAIELLIIASIVALVAVFATPMLSKALFNSDVKEAIDIIESSVENARETARYYQTEVIMRIETDEEQEQFAITVSIPSMRKDETMIEVQEEILLPAGVRVFSDERIIQFNADGEVELPAHTLLVFNQARDKGRQLVIE